MSKVRINDLAKELEVKSRAILDVLPELGVSSGKTHSSSLELDEAEKVRAHFARESKSRCRTQAARIGSPRRGAIVPKIDLSHISKPGDVMKAILAKKKEEEEEARHARVPAKPHRWLRPPSRRAHRGRRSRCRQARCRLPQPGQNRARSFRSRARRRPLLLLRRPLRLLHRVRPQAQSSPRLRAGVVPARPVVVVAPPPAGVVVKPPAAPAARDEKIAVKAPVVAAAPVAEAPAAPAAVTEQAAVAPQAGTAPSGAAAGAVHRDRRRIGAPRRSRSPSCRHRAAW